MRHQYNKTLFPHDFSNPQTTFEIVQLHLLQQSFLRTSNKLLFLCISESPANKASWGLSLQKEAVNWSKSNSSGGIVALIFPVFSSESELTKEFKHGELYLKYRETNYSHTHNLNKLFTMFLQHFIPFISGNILTGHSTASTSWSTGSRTNW